MDVDEVGRWRFCPACAAPLKAPAYSDEDQDDDRFNFEAPRCSTCERPWIACCCEPVTPWQPIATAPTDEGTLIVVREANGSIYLASRHRGVWRDEEFESHPVLWMPQSPPE